MPTARKILSETAAHARGCERCPLFRNATQTVFGQGPVPAPIMLVGEQPGDSEDKAGLPFVGPAGRILDSAMLEAGIARGPRLRHQRGQALQERPKRRIHQRPNRFEVEPCRWWLDQELKLVSPRIVVAMGVTAASALAGRAVTLSKEHGRILRFGDHQQGMTTIHPSYVLRLHDEARETAFQGFVADLKRVGELVPDAVMVSERRTIP
ncbi:MAG TPA: UdgX family uracil-DNA binding protein [Hyphomicrobiaceae bacterium]|nr:UdgX family uracil-DNA binding protein [Hyphomicrobiaceae bacterium]